MFLFQSSSSSSKASEPKKEERKAGMGKGKGKRGGKSGKVHVSSSIRAGLQFPVGRIGSYLRKRGYASRIAAGAPVYLAAVLEYLTSEILELAGNAAVQLKRKTINARALVLAIRNDEELNKLFEHATFAHGGVLPNLHTALLPCLTPAGNASRAKHKSANCKHGMPKKKKSSGSKKSKSGGKKAKSTKTAVAKAEKAAKKAIKKSTTKNAKAAIKAVKAAENKLPSVKRAT